VCHLCMRHAAKGHLAGMSAFGLRYHFESFIGLAPLGSAALQSLMIAANLGLLMRGEYVWWMCWQLHGAAALAQVSEQLNW
jgi:hypothetical protein